MTLKGGKHDFFVHINRSPGTSSKKAHRKQLSITAFKHVMVEEPIRFRRTLIHNIPIEQRVKREKKGHLVDKFTRDDAA